MKRPSRAMMNDRSRSIMKQVGVERYVPPEERPDHVGKYFDAEGNEITKAEHIRIQDELRQQREAEQSAARRAEIEGSLAPFGASLSDDEIINERTRLSRKFRMVCGCDHKVEFETTIHQLAAKAPAGKKPWCPQCWYMQPITRLDRILREKKGELIAPSRYKDSTSPVHLRCKTCKHEWKALPSNIFAGSWCPACAKNKNADRYELAMQEEAAERGFELLEWWGKVGKMVLLRPDGSEWEVRPNNFRGLPRKAERQINIAYDWDGNRAWVFGAQLPERVPSAIAAHLERSEIVPYPVPPVLFATPAAWGRYMGYVIEYCAGDGHPENPFRCGMEVLNTYRNPQWSAPGIYTWGEIEPFHGTLIETPEPLRWLHREAHHNGGT